MDVNNGEMRLAHDANAIHEGEASGVFEVPAKSRLD